MRAARWALPALLTVLAGPAPAEEPAEEPARAATLRVGVPAVPDAVAGFDRSLFAEAAREAGLGVVFEVMPPEAALVALDAGRLDVAAGPYSPGPASGRASGSAAGRRILAALAPDGDALLKRRGDGSLKRPADAAGKVLGLLGPAAAEGGTGASGPRLRAEAVALGGRLAVPPRAFADPLGALGAGRVAALIGTLPEVAAAALARPDDVEAVGPIPVRAAAAALAAVTRASLADGLADRLDAALGRMRADGRLAAVQRRWFGVALDPGLAGGPPGTGSAAAATSNP